MGQTNSTKKKNKHISNRKNKSNTERPTIPRSAKKIRPVAENVSFKKAHEQACRIKRKSRPPKKPAAAKQSRPVALNEVKDPQKINHILLKLLHPSVTGTEANKPKLRAVRGIITAQEPRKHTETAEVPLHRDANHKISEIKPIRDVKQETQDVPDVSGVNRSSSKRQVNELLTISLREEELNNSLQEVDWKLLKAQAVLHYAFIEVEHLQIIKQRITAEMTSLRAKQQ
ncbi:uncharacterized protein LOC134320783 [Trichomycterus rosablanca]|uniref:uncharacterized protein LOC134320783 n=1 Tax=Trichomycterus rosablanca TaxID=2290929 RepID=UPI002F35035E